MRRPARQREAIVAMGLIFSALGSLGADAAQTRLVTTCQAPKAASGAAPASVACDVRVSGPAVVETVSATVRANGEAGETAALESTFAPYDPAVQGVTTAYLIQILPPARRATLAQMADAVATFADQRQGKRRFTAYTFAGGLTPIAGSGASKTEFVRQIIAIKPASATIALYTSALEAVEALARETGERKALVILGDGTSDDAAGPGHDQVVQAARAAGVAIHVLGYYDDRAARSKFETLSRLAEDTGGHAVEVKQGPGAARDFSNDVVTGRFVGEVLENGGTLNVDLAGPPGARTLVLAAGLANGERLEAEHAVEVPAAPLPGFETTLQRQEPGPAAEPGGTMDRVALPLAVLLGLLAAGGYYGYRKYGHLLGGEASADGADAAGQAAAETVGAVPAVPEAREPAPKPAPRAADRPVVYGWLEMLDGAAERHPLRSANVRVGRLRDNDICLQNDSISRRHAVLNYNAETRRVVITDLGGSNGVLVNRTRYTSRELNDGDTVELGEVRLRFRQPRHT